MVNMTKPVKKTSKKLYDQLCTEIDRIFDLYGKPSDNCIVLGVYYNDRDSSWSRGHSCICEDSIALSKAGDFRYFSPYYDWDYEYNPYVRPVMHDVSAFTTLGKRTHDSPDEGIYVISRGLSVGPIGKESLMPKDVDRIPCSPLIEKLRDYYVDARKLVEMIKPLMHQVCGTGRSYCDSSTNCFWRNYIVVGRDYNFRTFTMRYDAMVSSRHLDFDSMIVDRTLGDCGHVKQHFTPAKEYAPTENVAIREPVPYIEWKDWKNHVRRLDTRYLRRGWRAGVTNLDVVPFASMKLKELPICMITDIFMQTYDRGSDPKLSNFFYYEPENRDEDIYALCQNSVYEFECYGRQQIGFNWYTMCCLHGDVNYRKGKSKKVVETYIGDMTPIEFIQFINKTFWDEYKEYTGDVDLLYYGLVKKLARPSYKNFGNYENGTQYCWNSIRTKPWYLTIAQYDEAQEILKIR